MTLATVYDAMFGFITGGADHEQAATQLYGDSFSRDARGLNVYRRNYLGNIADHAEKLFPTTHKVVLAKLGKRGWGRLVQALCAAGPLTDLRLGGEILVEILAGPLGGELGLPPWVVELADLEVWRRRIFVAPDASPSPGVAVNPVMVLREYAYDVRTVTLAEDPAAEDAVLGANVVAVWRTVDGERRTRCLGPIEIAVVRDIEVARALRAEAIAEQLPGRATVQSVKLVAERLAGLGLLTGIEHVRALGNIRCVNGPCTTSRG
jgi:hypothetical protein